MIMDLYRNIRQYKINFNVKILLVYIFSIKTFARIKLFNYICGAPRTPTTSSLRPQTSTQPVWTSIPSLELLPHPLPWYHKSCYSVPTSRDVKFGSSSLLRKAESINSIRNVGYKVKILMRPANRTTIPMETIKMASCICLKTKRLLKKKWIKNISIAPLQRNINK